MRHIIEYLSTNKEEITIGFPKKPVAKDIFNFLRTQHFIEVLEDYDIDDVYYEVYYNNSLEHPIFAHESFKSKDNKKVHYDCDNYFAFHNAEEITKDNPVFVCTIMHDDPSKNEYSIKWTTKYRHDHIPEVEYCKTYEEFRNKVNKHFEWQ